MERHLYLWVKRADMPAYLDFLHLVSILHVQQVLRTIDSLCAGVALTRDQKV